jgi:signal transduction histidine kinase
MTGYSIVLSVALREKSYLYYVLFLIWSTLFYFGFDGFVQQFFRLDVGCLNIPVSPLIAIAAILSLLKFTMTFLKTKLHTPRLHDVITGVLIAWAISGGLLLIMPSRYYGMTYKIMSGLSILSMLICLSAGYLTWRQGQRSARYFLAAWIVFFITAIVWMVSEAGFLPSNAFTAYSVRVGEILLVLLFSSVLIARIYWLKTSLRQVSEEQKQHQEHLEELVNERTRKLQNVNKRLRQRIAEQRRAEKAANAASRAKSEFLSRISHEFRTPLNGILGYAQILKRRIHLDSSQNAGLNIIKQSGEHLLTLLNDILDLAKIEAGKLELCPDDFYLRGFLDGIVGIMQMKAQQKGIVFTYDAITPLPSGVRADEKRLRQVLLNLLDNAVKFTDSGTVTLRVETVRRAVSDPKTGHRPVSTIIRFEIEDTGGGMASDQLEKIFLPFEQVGDMRRRAAGTGLGSAISRQLVELMGGALQVRSQAGVGSLFWFEVELPVVDIENRHISRVPENIVGYAGRRLTVLVVDDDSHSRAVLVNAFEPLGFTVIEVETGQEAVTKTQQMHPDLILMDLRMPEMTGFETIRKIRKADAQHPAPSTRLSLPYRQAFLKQIDKKANRLGVMTFYRSPLIWIISLRCWKSI